MKKNFFYLNSYDGITVNVSDCKQLLLLTQVNSRCQRLLQSFWWVFVYCASFPVLRAELGQIIPQHTHHLLSCGVQTDPVTMIVREAESLK